MKNKLLLLLPILCLFLSSCFDIEETYNLNEDGSYAVDYNLNMGGMMGMVSMMMPDSVKQKADFKAAKDTTINLGKGMPDSLAIKLTAQEKSLMSATNMHMQVDMSKGVFKIGFNNQGKSTADLKYFLSDFGNALKKTKATSRMMPSGLSSPASGNDDSDVSIKNDEYDYVITANSFERRKKTQAVAKAEQDKQVYEMMKNMKMKMESTVIINLPRAAKSVDNPKAILSADRKQFKLVVDLMEAIDKPELLNFKVTY